MTDTTPARQYAPRTMQEARRAAVELLSRGYGTFEAARVLGLTPRQVLALLAQPDSEAQP